MLKKINIHIDNKEAFLLLSAAMIAFLWVFQQHLTFGMDSKTYLQYANWLVGNEGISPHWYIRSPGLPILLVLSGVTKFQSFLGFCLLQAAISVGIVWLCYKIAAVFNPDKAIYFGYFFLISAVPFIFSAAVMTEHINLFAHCLLCYCLLQVYAQQNKFYVRMAAVATIMLFLIRPSNYYIFFISLLFITWFGNTNRRKFVISFAAIYLTFALCYICLFSLLKMSHPGYEGMSSIFQGVRAIAYTPYHEHGFDSSNGNANKDLVLTVDKYTADLSVDQIKELGPQELFGSFAEDKAQLIAQIYGNPNGYYYNFITQALVREYGRRQAEFILLKASAETFIAKPEIFLTWVKTIFSSSANNYTGQMLFYSFMLKAGSVVSNESEVFKTKVNAENGPATAELIKLVRHFIITYPKWMHWEPKELFSDFKENPEDLITNIFANPTHVYHWFIWQAVDREVGPLETSRIFMNAAIEGYKKYPASILTFFDDFICYFLGPDITYKSGSRVVYWPNTGMGEKVLLPTMSDSMQHQIVNDKHPQFWHSLYQCYSSFWLLSKPIIFLLAVYGLFISYGTSKFKLVACIWALILYNALIVTIFADPFFRYSAVTWLLSSCVAAYAASQIISLRRAPSGVADLGMEIVQERR